MSQRDKSGLRVAEPNLGSPGLLSPKDKSSTRQLPQIMATTQIKTTPKLPSTLVCALLIAHQDVQYKRNSNEEYKLPAIILTTRTTILSTKKENDELLKVLWFDNDDNNNINGNDH
uniref:Uncharacterized protein n=1 Tax=Glossina austeni TaxID=7395 RepID=A0A1A9UPE1_GLOAU